jgi:hypothetical protein
MRPIPQWGTAHVSPHDGDGPPQIEVLLAPVSEDRNEWNHLHAVLAGVDRRGGVVSAELTDQNMLRIQLTNAQADIEAVKQDVKSALDLYTTEAEQREQYAASEEARTAQQRAAAEREAAELQDRLRRG